MFRLTALILAQPLTTRDDLQRCLRSLPTETGQCLVVDLGVSLEVRGTLTASRAECLAPSQLEDRAGVRNEALQHVRGEWILCLEPDEALEAGSEKRLAAALEDASVGAYELPVYSCTDGLRNTQSLLEVRLLRSDPLLRWERPVHEELTRSLLLMLQVRHLKQARLPVSIFSHLPPAPVLEQRARATRRMLIQAHRRHPEDPFYLYRLASDCRSERPQEAIQLIERASERLLRASPGDLVGLAYPIEVFAQAVQDATAQHKDPRALHLADEALMRLEHPLLRFLRAVLHWRAGAYDASQVDLERCLGSLEQPQGVDFDQLEVTWRAHFMLGELLFRQGFLLRAEQCFSTTLEIQPGHAQARAYLLRIRALTGDVAGALQSCVRWLRGEGDAEAALLCGELLMGLGRMEAASRWLRSVERDFAGQPWVLERVRQLRERLQMPA